MNGLHAASLLIHNSLALSSLCELCFSISGCDAELGLAEAEVSLSRAFSLPLFYFFPMLLDGVSAFFIFFIFFPPSCCISRRELRAVAAPLHYDAFDAVMAAVSCG